MSEQLGYDEAVAYLTERPGEIETAWENPMLHPAGRLFRYATTDGNHRFGCGCLTQVRDGTHVACRPDITAAIRADERIPRNPQEVTPDHLPVLAGWQRRCDILLNRPSPDAPAEPTEAPEAAMAR